MTNDFNRILTYFTTLHTFSMDSSAILQDIQSLWRTLWSLKMGLVHEIVPENVLRYVSSFLSFLDGISSTKCWQHQPKTTDLA